MADPNQLTLAAQNLTPGELANLLARLPDGERKQMVIDLLAAGVDAKKVLAAVRDIELQHGVERKRRWKTLWLIAATTASAAGWYHGYRRTGSVGWAFGWGAMGALLPVPTVAIALAQGFGKTKPGVELRGSRRYRR